MTSSVLHDVVIVGGGPVGGALALALEPTGLSVLVLEARNEQARADDPRTLALSYGSRLILERLGVWNDLTPVTSITSIHVSHSGAFGRTVLTAEETGQSALGYVVSHSTVQRALSAGLERVQRIVRLYGARATRLEADAETVRIEVDEHGTRHDLHARLTVIADGGATAQALTWVDVRDYGQSAVVATVHTSKPHGNRAFERFTPAGPLALLPRESGYALIWSMAPDAAHQLCAAPPDVFLAQLQAAFGGRAGRFITVTARASFPLSLRVARAPGAARTLLLGNAAQTLHPVAGQGLNLGLRDAWELGECVQSCAGDPGGKALLAAYASRRARDRAGGVLLTDTLVRVFSNDHMPLRWLRGCGLTFLDNLPPVKRAFAQQMMFGRPY
ncbi:MAG TPA: FAD-dependent monooxygenase [Burkholderiales bacterium]|nr:FAD-dependent monooxygenase [Burkholderiales bacterium]